MVVHIYEQVLIVCLCMHTCVRTCVCMGARIQSSTETFTSLLQISTVCLAASHFLPVFLYLSLSWCYRERKREMGLGVDSHLGDTRRIQHFAGNQ